jgi:hypothetical protein
MVPPDPPAYTLDEVAQKLSCRRDRVVELIEADELPGSILLSSQLATDSNEWFGLEHGYYRLPPAVALCVFDLFRPLPRKFSVIVCGREVFLDSWPRPRSVMASAIRVTAEDLSNFLGQHSALGTNQRAQLRKQILRQEAKRRGRRGGQAKKGKKSALTHFVCSYVGEANAKGEAPTLKGFLAFIGDVREGDDDRISTGAGDDAQPFIFIHNEDVNEQGKVLTYYRAAGGKPRRVTFETLQKKIREVCRLPDK